MTRNHNAGITNYMFVRFVEQLHDMHSYGGDFDDRVEAVHRCQRWLDATLPPDIEFEISDEDLKELKKAAE